MNDTQIRRFKAIEAFQRTEILELAAARPEDIPTKILRPHYAGIGEWLPPGQGGKVLELGCGPGRFVAMLAALGYDVVGVDPLPYTLWDEIKAVKDVEFLSGVKAEALPFDDNSFDHVACVSALLYFDDARKSLAEIKRVLKPGGRLYVRTINSDNLRRKFSQNNIDPAAGNYFNEKELREFLEVGGFAVKKTFGYGLYPPFMTDYWWYLINGPLPFRIQEILSALTPRRYRVSVMAFAELPVEEIGSR
jgi:SAM-dependent methyltransferase